MLTQNLPFSLSIGAAIRLTGSWVPSPAAGQSHELHVDNVQVLGPSDAKVSHFDAVMFLALAALSTFVLVTARLTCRLSLDLPDTKEIPDS